MGLLLLWTVAARSLDSLSIELDGIDAGDWATGPLSVRIEAHGTQGFGFDMEVRRLRLPAPLSTIRRIRVHCPEGLWAQGHLRCAQAVISPMIHEAPAEPLVLALDYALEQARLRLRGRQLAVAGGRLDLELDVSAAGGRVQISARELELPKLLALTGQLPGRWPALEPYAVSAGRADLDLEFSPSQAGAGGNLDVRVGIRNLDFSDSEGLHAGQALGLQLRLGARERNGVWHFHAEGSTPTGLLYLDPLLLDADAGAPELQAEGRWQPGRLLEISSFDFHHPRVLRLKGGGRWTLAPAPRLEQLRAVLPKTPLAPVYEHYLKAYTGAGALSDLAMEGALEIEIDWRAGGAGRADARLTDLSLGDASGLFAIIGLEGDLHWRASKTGPVSRLNWDGAQLYRLDLGAGSMDLGLREDTVELLSPVRLRLFSGALEVPRLRARGLGHETLDLELAARLDNIDLGELGNTLAWVPLSGRLSASIPSLRYRDSRLLATGAIDLSLFDGQARITKLSLEDPFGPVPRLGADLDLRDLSLEQLSQSFSFGAIEGRLQGSIRNLVLDGWQPVSFDARLQTPPGDATRHRISQRAVDNLASLGGANAVLSSTFLRFFNDFSYRRLGLSCRLRAGVCEMDGVAPAEPGYYIVEGGGIPPRVDVVGYNHRVDWQTLLERLRAINQLDEVVVQ